jgi:signal transduction histidine kinase
MSLHQLLPLGAFVLNVILVTLALVRNGGSRLNRVFAYCVGSMAVWNFGAFMLRRAPDAEAAWHAEVLIHAAVVLIPAFYYHFVLIFLDSTREHRRSLALAYGLAGVFSILNLIGSPLFMKGVVTTAWGWAPATGPLYLVYIVFVHVCLGGGPWLLLRAERRAESSFRRNRARLIVLATFITLAGGFVDITRFIVARFVPAADHVYPLGIPANMLFALLLGISIVRYRLFDVSATLKKAAVYSVVGGIYTAAIVAVVSVLEGSLGWSAVESLWAAITLGMAGALMNNPFGRAVDRFLLSRRTGCRDTIVGLSKRMSTMLDVRLVTDTLVEELVRGVPATRCALLMLDRDQQRFVVSRESVGLAGLAAARPLAADSPIVAWLRGEDGVLVKEEAKLDPRLSAHFQAAEWELDELPASIVVPLKVDRKLIGILLLGEKLSGEIFDGDELELLSVLASQAAVALENGRLYEELGASNVRLAEASRHKSRFLAGMSHELRTPLNSITGFSKLLLNRVDGDLTPLQTTYVQSIHTSGTHLLQLINGVLDMARIEAGKLEVHREPVTVTGLVDECVESARALAEGKALRIEADLPPDLPPVDGDRTKLKQVLLNLLSNAIKFTPSGRVVVRVRREAAVLHVMVADTGPGISQADLPRLFEPFTRLDGAARDAAGTGLGLMLSKRFVEMHRGRIWVESREGQGSTFHFTLPAVPQPAEGLVTV